VTRDIAIPFGLLVDVVLYATGSGIRILLNHGVIQINTILDWNWDYLGVPVGCI
jgi:hypothetical protein